MLMATLAPADSGWQLSYIVRGDLQGLRLPPPLAAPGRADGLWRHTCFELFCADATTPAYGECNFSPSGAWASYRFLRERVPAAPVYGAAAAECKGQRSSARELALGARIPVVATPGHALIGLSAVLEASDGSLSYWALRHPRPRPDFHARAGWVPLDALSSSSSTPQS